MKDKFKEIFYRNHKDEEDVRWKESNGGIRKLGTR